MKFEIKGDVIVTINDGKRDKIDLVKFHQIINSINISDTYEVYFSFGDLKCPTITQAIVYRTLMESIDYVYIHTDNELMLSQLDGIAYDAHENSVRMRHDIDGILQSNNCMTFKKLDSDEPEVKLTLILELLEGCRYDNPTLILRNEDFSQDLLDYMRLYCRCRILSDDMIDKILSEEPTSND